MIARVRTFLSCFLATVSVASVASASSDGSGGHGGAFPLLFLLIVVMLLFARVGALVERFGQTAVLGELLMGMALGACVFLPGGEIIAMLRSSELVRDLAEIGVILLLFKAGLETSLVEMKESGARSAIVAVVGVILPFVGGYIATGLLFPDTAVASRIFIGATLTATSVGITARVLGDLGVMSWKESKVILGAAVIDDILGLIILATVSGIVTSGSLDVATVAIITTKAFVFLGGSIVLGRVAAPLIGRMFSRIHSGVGMKMAIALLFCATFSYGASALAGLAPIVGAFAAGLVLDHVHFSTFAPPAISGRIRNWADWIGHGHAASQDMRSAADREEHGHVEHLVDGISSFFVPLFFVATGMSIDLTVFGDLSLVLMAVAIAAVAFAGKWACGLVAGRSMSGSVVGIGMVPRGEVGLIFANEGRRLGAISDELFAVMVIVVILTTFVAPPLLSAAVRRKKALLQGS